MQTILKRTLAVVLSAGFLTAAIAAGGYYAETHTNRTEHQQKMVERFADKLDLNPTQKDKLKALSEVLSKQRQAMRGDGDLRNEMQNLISGTKLDRSKALALAEAKTKAMQQATPLVINAAADFYDSLNPEQQSKVRQWMEKHKRWGSRG